MQNIITFLRRTAVAVLFASFPFVCAQAQDDSSTPPIATNSVKAVSLGELNLRTNDYTVLPPITVTSLVSLEIKGKREFIIRVEDEDEDVILKYRWKSGSGSTPGKWELRDWDGLIKLGFMSHGTALYTPDEAADVAKRLAFYRLIAQAQTQGADGIVEPIISTNMAKNGKQYFFKATVTARPLILKTN